MTILVDKDTRLIIQGITGNEGLFHAQRMLLAGTNIVAGVTPGKGGDWVLDGKIPVFDTVRGAVETTGGNASLIFVPLRFAADAMLESIDSKLPLIVCVSEGIPIHEMLMIKNYLNKKSSRLIGPNSPGLLSPGEANVGIIPNDIVKSGNVGLISRSGTLTYEVMALLGQNNIGISTCVGIGGDPILGSSFVDILELFEDDPHTERIVLVGEIGGRDEEIAADYISKKMTKPVVAYVAGISAPPGRRMGHAGAIISGGKGGAKDKIEALQKAGALIAKTPALLGKTMLDALTQ
jgi:succinyl-CoA synthetase alpha subunit